MKYPIGVQSFEALRKDGYVYVDKTALVYRLTSTSKYVFLGRPRRFGKSLLMSTIQAYFEGKEELFRGLAIEKLESEWHRHPVLHFDLNPCGYNPNQEKEVKSVLGYQLGEYEKIYGGIDDTIYNRLLNVIKSAYEQTGRKVVVLIDEYDKPILSTMTDEKAQNAIRGYLKSFYACLKTSDQYIRFAMLTGVSKFGQLSVFSDLNNVEDISLNKNYAAICGLTQEEILATFSSEIDAFARECEMTKDALVERLKSKYDGYRFSKARILVFNPFSLLSAIKNREFNDYWFQTGTPTFLVQLLQKNDYDLSHIDGAEIGEDSLYLVDDINVLPLLYQAGYLTIKDYEEEAGLCVLGYPNQEVEAGFLRFLIPYYSKIREQDTKSELHGMVRELKTGATEAFMTHLQSLFSDIPYAHDNSSKVQEDQVRNLIYIIFKLMGLHIHVECPMSRGRSDAIVWTHDRIYIFEFKIDSTAKEAIEQILRKGYAEPFQADPRQVILIGVNYSTKKRCIDSYHVD